MKLKWLKVSHLENNLHQKLIIPRKYVRSVCYKFCKEIHKLVFQTSRLQKNWLHTGCFCSSIWQQPLIVILGLVLSGKWSCFSHRPLKVTESSRVTMTLWCWKRSWLLECIPGTCISNKIDFIRCVNPTQNLLPTTCRCHCGLSTFRIHTATAILVTTKHHTIWDGQSMAMPGNIHHVNRLKCEKDLK